MFDLTGIRRHTVQRGETLATIAQAYYHDPAAWGTIYRHNSHYIQDPNHVPEGTVLVIPHLVNPKLLEEIWL